MLFIVGHIISELVCTLSTPVRPSSFITERLQALDSGEAEGVVVESEGVSSVGGVSSAGGVSSEIVLWVRKRRIRNKFVFVFFGFKIIIS